jgi:Peptidase C39 family
MLRPIYLDLCDVLVPLSACLGALAGGHHLHRLPRSVFTVILAISVAVILILGVSYFIPFPEPIYDVLWHVGGEATVACVLAALLLGVVWSSRKRTTSTGFLRVMAGLVAGIIVLGTGGRLWWRLVSEATWQNTPNVDGCLTQSTGWTCSPATATMLLHHYGIAASEGEMAYLANTSYLGTDARSIAHALTLKGRPHGLRAQVVLADYETCLGQPKPFLACVRVPGIGGHAVLVRRINAESIDLIDPRFGHRQTLLRAEIEPHWEGRIVYLEVE